jgi:hypothetical protein
MNNEFESLEQELKSLHPRQLSSRATAQIRRELEPVRWPWWLATGLAAAASIVLAAAWFSLHNTKPQLAKQSNAIPSLLLSRQYDGIVTLDRDVPYRRTRYHVERASATGPTADIIVLQKASLD